MTARRVAFTVPPTTDGVFIVELADGSLYQVNTPDYVAAGQRLLTTVAEESILLEYYHSEGEAGKATPGREPQLVIGSRVSPEDAGGVRVAAEMNKAVSFAVPPVDGDQAMCLVALDDGRLYEVTVPDYVAAGQTLSAFVDDGVLLIEYYHSEGEVGSTDTKRTPRLVIGNLVTSSFYPRVEAVTLHPRHK